MKFLREVFCEGGTPSSKRVLGGVMILAVVIGWGVSVRNNGLGQHETDLAEVIIYVAGVLLGITPVANAIKGRQAPGNDPKNEDSDENV